MTAGSFGNFDGRPVAILADSSSKRATCSTIWLGDHFPGACGEVQAVPVRSPVRINCSIASLLASRAALTSAIGPPFPEHARADPTPRQERLSGMRALSIRKRVFISGGSIDRWHRYVEQSQVDQQLSTMVIPAIEQERPEIGRARCRKQFSASGHESPRRARAFIAQSRPIGLRLLRAGRESGQEFL